jgi:proteasome lid subunit RPN8/RPN11
MLDIKSYLPVPQEEISRAIKHAERVYPKESCGAIINNKYVEYFNDAIENEDSFEINNPTFYSNYALDKIQAVVHSHNNQPHASKLDQEKQKDLGVPFIIINIKYGKFEDIFFFGYKDIILPYEGRPFHFGAWDCLSLVCDYYKKEFDVEVVSPSRNYNFNETGEKTFELYLDKVPFTPVKKEDMLKNDVIFYTWNNQICHVGIYLGDDKVLAHWGNQESAIHHIDYKRKHISFAMEYNK